MYMCVHECVCGGEGGGQWGGGGGGELWLLNFGVIS